MKNKQTSRGFTLIAALLLLVLLSGIAVGLMMMVNTEARVGGNDVQNNLAYHQAEGAIEAMSSDLANMYHNIQAPSVSDFATISTMAPSDDPTVSYPDFTATPHTDDSGDLAVDWGQISSGPNAGLYAQILQVDLKATALRNSVGGQEVTMLRTVEVALIPVFQFGVFSDSDLAFFTSPNLDFEGRVHTNGNLFLGAAGGYTVSFNDKVTAYGEVIRTVLPNNLAANCGSCNDGGTVNILTATNGCNPSKPTACRSMKTTEGSVTGTSLSNLKYNSGPPSWITVSKSTYNYEITNGDNGGTNGTGVSKLALPFVGGGAQPYEIIRQPPSGEVASSPIGASREFNLAEIRVMLADDPTELCNGSTTCVGNGSTDPQNIRLANVVGANGVDYSKGVPISGTAWKTYFAEGTTGMPNGPGQTGSLTSLPGDWPYNPYVELTGESPDANAPWVYNNAKIPQAAPNVGICATNPTNSTGTAPCTGSQQPYGLLCGGGTGLTAANCTTPYYFTFPSAPTYGDQNTWNLLDGYIRVEYKDSNGTWHPATQEWLGYGFARGATPPITKGSNPVHPNAILILQKLADRNWDGNIDTKGAAPTCKSWNKTKTLCTGGWTYATPPEVLTDSKTASPYYTDGTNLYTAFNWYPINFYDTREGEQRDSNSSDTTCTANGLMNAVELDVGNLQNWLANTANGKNVDTKTQNGYILYFSDRRGMLANPTGTGVDPANTKTGDSGLEDIINTDGKLEPPSLSANSPEDGNLNGKLDSYGASNLGLGFFGDANGGSNNLNTDINKGTKNPYVRISTCSTAGKNWVSGARHVLKLVDGTLGNLPTPGFTVASENPVYIVGDYNTNSSDGTWQSPPSNGAHSAASVIADAVTLLSNGWQDRLSLLHPRDAISNRPAASATYYRTAIAAGKNQTFPYLYTDVNFSFGTDGGLHNFLRFLENWSSSTLWYKGSMVSLYYSTYATGTFKCCSYSVYEPPTRKYFFDELFANYQNLPPGTPMFRDVEKLSYRQDFTARSN